MRTLQAALVIVLCVLATACASGTGQMAAAPLMAAKDASGSTNLEKVHDLVQDSQKKCADFTIAMFGLAASSNTFLDIASTALSAVATVFTPTTTVHVLTAGSTIAGSAKTSIQTEYLNSVTISHIVQAIQSTYSADMTKYIAYLDTISDARDISVVAERSTILSYHNECSLPAANGSIASALQPASAKQPSTQLSLTFTVPKTGDSAVTIASGILAQINTDATFKAAGVTASEQPGGPNGTITLTVPAPLAITWTPATFVASPGKTATETAVFDHGPPATLQVKGTGQEHDTLTVTALVGASTQKPPAAKLGVAPQLK
jgi:hypothetical protein